MDAVLSPSAIAGILDAPPEATADWKPFSLQVLAPPPELKGVFQAHALSLRISGRHRLRQEIEGRALECWGSPGAVNLVPAGAHAVYAAGGPCRIIAVYIPNAFLSRVIAQHWEADPRHVEITRQFLVRDPVIEGVLLRLAEEARNSSPSGGLYAESACEYLAHHVIDSYIKHGFSCAAETPVVHHKHDISSQITHSNAPPYGGTINHEDTLC